MSNEFGLSCLQSKVIEDPFEINIERPWHLVSFEISSHISSQAKLISNMISKWHIYIYIYISHNNKILDKGLEITEKIISPQKLSMGKTIRHYY